MKPLKLPAVQLATMWLAMLLLDLLSGTYILEINLCVRFMLLVAMSRPDFILKWQVVNLRRE